MITYVDSSVLLRVVLGEADPLAQWDSLEPASSELIRVESLRVIERYRLMSAIDDEIVAERREAILAHLEGFRLVELSRAVLDRAAEPLPIYVATLDAIHLATALELRFEYEQLAFATHDVKLAAAARSLAFSVIGV